MTQIRFNTALLNLLPTLRVTVLFFGLCGLDILNSIGMVPSHEREQIIEWIYAQQVLPDKSGLKVFIFTCTFF